MTDLEKQELAARPWDAEADQETFGIKDWVGESGYTPIEIRHLRPTLEVVGFHGGIDGISAVIPNEARRISCVVWLLLRCHRGQQSGQSSY